MRLAIRFSPATGTLAGSQNTVAQNLIPALFAEHEDSLLFTSSRDAFPAIPADRVRDVPRIMHPESRLRSVASLLQNQRTFADRLRREHCAVVFYPYTFEAVPASPGLRQLITVQDTLPLVFPRQFPRSSWYWRFRILPILRDAAGVLVPSANTRNDLLSAGGFEAARIHLVHPGYRPPVSAGTPSPASGAPYLLYVSSSQYPYKNIAALMTVFDRLAGRIPHDLVVLSKADDRFMPTLARQRAGLSSGSRIRLIEELTNAELQRLYAGAHTFVYPSCYEGFGIPPLEAMAFGVPVVSSNAASIPEVCGDAAEYFDALNLDEMASAIMTVVHDPERRAALIAAGYRRCELFSWQESARGIVAIARRALSGGSS
jgi:glycosyltransferase involved in cell wall biosynthesis